MATVTVTRVDRSGGRIVVSFSDKVQLDFGAVDDLRQFAGDTTDLARRIAIGMWMARDPTLADEAKARRTVTLDLAGGSPVR